MILLLFYCFSVVEPKNGSTNLLFFKWQYRAGAGAGAGAEIKDNGGAKKEPEPKINNYGSATLHYSSNECANANIRQKK